MNAQGRILAEGQPGIAASAGFSTSGPTWDPLTMLDPGTDSFFEGPTFDPSGNAFALLNDLTDVQHIALSSVSSISTSGSWRSPQQILTPAQDGAGAIFAIASNGVIHAVYRAGAYQIRWIKYVPGSGWQDPITIFSTTSFFQTIRMVLDSSDNPVVVFDANGLSSVSYSQATGTWSRPQTLATFASIPTLSRSPGGSAGHADVCDGGSARGWPDGFANLYSFFGNLADAANGA